MFITTHGFAATAVTWGASWVLGQPQLRELPALGGAFVLGTLPDWPVAALIALGRFDPRRHRHHGWITHTPAFWIALGLLLGWGLHPRAGLMTAGCALLHLSLDWVGGGDGIPFLFPLTRRRFGVGLSGNHAPRPLLHYFTRGRRGMVESSVTLAGLAVLLGALLPFLR